MISGFCDGCANTATVRQPIAYLAVERPKGVISTPQHAPVKKEFPRGGWYFGNSNFRPAPDLASYIDNTAPQANTKILRNAEVQLNVPFALDILFFGYAKGTDLVTAQGK
jgi:hypothetical protein